MQLETKKSAVPFLSCDCGYMEKDGEQIKDFASPGFYLLLCKNKSVRGGKKNDVLIGKFELTHYSLPALMLGRIRKASEKCSKCSYHGGC